MWTIYGDLKSTTTIIAIPALGERKEMYMPLANCLSDAKWLVFDLPGSHKQQQSVYSIPTFCQFIKDVMADEQIQQAHFIGNSLGAWAIQAFASMFPQSVQSLSLLDGGHYFLGERGVAHEDVELAANIESFDDIAAAIHELTYSMRNLSKQAYENFEQYFLGNYILHHDFYAHHCDEIAYNALSKELLTIDYCLKQTAIPLQLVIADASADDFSKAKAIDFKHQFPHAVVTSLEHGQHYLPLTNTPELAATLHSFYKTITKKDVSL